MQFSTADMESWHLFWGLLFNVASENESIKWSGSGLSTLGEPELELK
jgi:hypothetical protein